MSLQETIRTDMVSAMKAREELKLSVLRGLLTLFTNELTATKRTPQDKLTDDEVLTLIRRALKQRKEAGDQFRAGGRPELAEKEDAEGAILSAYLPQMMSREEVEAVVKAKIEALGAVDKSGLGKLIGSVMGELKGRADGAMVKEIVESLIK